MLKTLKKHSTLLATGALVAIIAGCTPPPNTTDPGNGGTETASIVGTVTKEDGSPANNATVILKDDNKGTDVEVARSNADGQYKFSKVPAGDKYRVAFVIASEDERKKGLPVIYDPNGKTGQYYGFITSINFSYDGDTTKTFQIPAFNVGWVANMTPTGSVSMSDDIKFSWAAAKGAKEYNLIVKKDVSTDPEKLDLKDFYKTSKTFPETSWTWKKADFVGNQGSFKDKPLEAGNYYWFVNAIFEKDADNPVSLNYGGTSNAPLTIK